MTEYIKNMDLPENISPPVKPMLEKCVELLKPRRGDAAASYQIIPLDESFRAEADTLIQKEWAGPMIVTKGHVIDTRACFGFVAEDEGRMLGCITYRIADNECEITTLNSLCEGQGIGSALINAVVETAKRAACSRIWLITTNDNTHAIRFYQRFGFTLAAVHINALNRSRELKPSIPLTGMDDIPIRHEMEFEMRL